MAELSLWLDRAEVQVKADQTEAADKVTCVWYEGKGDGVGVMAELSLWLGRAEVQVKADQTEAADKVMCVW